MWGSIFESATVEEVYFIYLIREQRICVKMWKSDNYCAYKLVAF